MTSYLLNGKKYAKISMIFFVAKKISYLFHLIRALQSYFYGIQSHLRSNGAYFQDFLKIDPRYSRLSFFGLHFCLRNGLHVCAVFWGCGLVLHITSTYFVITFVITNWTVHFRNSLPWNPENCYNNSGVIFVITFVITML